jgi:outer membrane protein assembly factor BamB
MAQRFLIWLSIIVSLALSCAPQYRLAEEDISRSSPWPFHRGDLSSKGSVHEGMFNGKLDIIWERKRGEKPAGPLSVYHGSLVYPGTKNKIRFYDAITGEDQGYIKSHGEAQTNVSILDSLAIFATSPRKSWLRCVNLRSGKQLWKQRIKDAAAGSIIIDNKLLIGSTDGRLTAYRSEDGNMIWTFEAEGGFIAPPSCADGRIFQPCDDGTLYVITPTDGSELYRVEVNGPMVSTVAVSTMVYATDIRGYVYGIDPENGQIVWNNRLNGPIWTTPAVSDERLFVGHSAGELVALDATDGQILWQFDTGEVVRASATVVGNYVLVGTMGGKLFSLNTADGRLIEQRQLNGAVAWPPVADGDRIYVATESGMIICFGEKDE